MIRNTKKAVWVAVGAVVAGSATLMAPAARAQVAQQTYTIAAMEASCLARPNSVPRYCTATSQHARSRYGDRVSIYQWNAAIGVVRNQIRQGKI